MSLRVDPSWFSCKECSANIVMLDYEMLCPKCGRDISVPFTDKALFVEDAIYTMVYYKEDHGMYRPYGFYVCDIGYKLLYLTYSFFDFLEQKKPENNEVFLDEFIQGLKVEDAESEGYLPKHFRDGIAKVLAIYENQGFEKYIEETNPMRKAREKDKDEVNVLSSQDVEKIGKRSLWDKLREKYS